MLSVRGARSEAPVVAHVRCAVLISILIYFQSGPSKDGGVYNLVLAIAYAYF
jgi:hypothetical protein